MKLKKRRNCKIAASMISMICAMHLIQAPASVMSCTLAETNMSVHYQTATPCSEDIIVIKYRTYNNRLQYRRWNDTKKIWVDPYWIDL
ncbi:MAG: hypothetical protein Q4C59_02555 [Lachnospiraceae bacterium]|nr:hypothetical protein [Lachnospiraceae bacterium]